METTTAKDTFTWHFTYHNGIQVPEFDQSRPDGRALADVDVSQVKQLDLDTSDMLGKHSVVIPDGVRPVFLRRRCRIVNIVTEQDAAGPVVHCIGWKSEKSECYLFIFEDGSTLLTSDFNAV